MRPIFMSAKRRFVAGQLHEEALERMNARAMADPN
jgi:hypothetical protein